MNYKELIQEARSDFSSRLGQAKLLKQRQKDLKEEIAELELLVDRFDRISAFLSSFSDEQQEAIHTQIETVVTAGLQTIFQSEMQFYIRTKMVGKRLDTEFILVSKEGSEQLETSILDARGGGVAAVAGFLMQATLVLLIPGMRKVLFLDETFAQVSVNYQPALNDFIKELTEKTELQVIMVTHSEVFGENADKVYSFSQKNGVTSCREVKGDLSA